MPLAPETAKLKCFTFLEKTKFSPFHYWKTRLCAKILYIPPNPVLKHVHFFLLVYSIFKWKIFLWFFQFCDSSSSFSMHPLTESFSFCCYCMSSLSDPVEAGIPAWCPHLRACSPACLEAEVCWSGLSPFFLSCILLTAQLFSFTVCFLFFQQCGHLACLTVLTCQVKTTNISHLTWVCVVSVKHIAFICLFKHVKKENWKAFF